MAIVAVFATVLGSIVFIILGLKFSQWLETRKIDKMACRDFERYFNVHAEAEAEMRKLYATVNMQTRKALDTHFGHSISFIRRSPDVDDRNSNRSISLRF